MTFKIRFTGQTADIPEENLTPGMRLTDAPLYREDRLEFKVLDTSVPSPLPTSVTVSIGTFDFGTWELTTRQRDDVGFSTFTAKRLSNEQVLADAVSNILANQDVTYAAMPEIQKRWATILDDEMNLWISRRLLDKGDRPSLDIFYRELPKYGYTLTTESIAPFNDVDAGISVIPINSASNTVALQLPVGYKITTQEVESVIPVLTRSLSFTIDSAVYSGGTGYDFNMGVVHSLGEGVVLSEMKRYGDFYRQHTISAEFPLNAAYKVRQKVRTGRDSRDWIVEGVTHTESTTTLRLIPAAELTVAELQANSIPPYNTMAIPYNSAPRPPTARIFHSIEDVQDPGNPSITTTVDWLKTGGGAIAEITPDDIGYPLAAIEWRVLRVDAVSGRATIYLEGRIEDPQAGRPSYVMLVPMGFYTNYRFEARSLNTSQNRDAAGNLLNASTWAVATPNPFRITFGKPEITGQTMLPVADMNNTANMTTEAQQRMFANAQINRDVSAVPEVTRALLLTGAGIAGLLALVGGAGALWAVVASIPTTAGAMTMTAQMALAIKGGWIGTTLAFTGWVAGSSIAAAASALTPLIVLVAPIVFLNIYGQIVTASQERLGIILECWGAGRPVGIQVHVRYSTVVNNAAVWSDWVELGTTIEARGNDILSTKPTLVDNDNLTRERLLNTRWLATYGAENQASAALNPGISIPGQNKPIVGNAAYFRFQLLLIRGINADGEATGALPATDRDGNPIPPVYTDVIDVREWSRRQYEDDGSPINPAIPTYQEPGPTPPF